MAKYRKKPVVIDAHRWTGTDPDGINAGARWMDEVGAPEDVMQIDGTELPKPAKVHIKTLGGVMTCEPGDWIIRGIKGEFYPCKDEIFQATYTPVASEGEISLLLDEWQRMGMSLPVESLLDAPSSARAALEIAIKLIPALMAQRSK